MSQDKKNEVQLNAADLLEPTPEPVQVKNTDCTFVPWMDIEARVNQDVYILRAEVPQTLPRELATHLAGTKRGYIKD